MPLLVGHVDLGLQGPRAGLQRARDARDGAAKLDAGHLGNAHDGADPLLQAERLVLRHIELDADHVAVHHGEHRHAAGGVGLHQAAVVDVALGDDAVERRHHALIGLVLEQHLELGLLGADVRLGDRDGGLLRLQVQPFGVALLLGDPALVEQLAVARPGDARDLAIGLGLVEGGLVLRERRLRLRDLVIELLAPRSRRAAAPP